MMIVIIMMLIIDRIMRLVTIMKQFLTFFMIASVYILCFIASL